MTIKQATQLKPHPYAYACMNKVHGQGRITINAVVEYVSEYYEMPIGKIMLKTRKRPILKVRQVAMYVARKATNMSYEAIGEYFGGFDHTTVLNAMGVVEDAMFTDEEFRDKVNHVLRYFGLQQNHDKLIKK